MLTEMLTRPATIALALLQEAQADDAASYGRTMLAGFGRQLIATLAFTILGLLLFALAFWIIGKVTPFSIRKELEEDQNTAIAIVIAAVIIGIALIVSAAVHG
jgi:putative membrane protein